MSLAMAGALATTPILLRCVYDGVYIGSATGCTKKLVLAGPCPPGAATPDARYMTATLRWAIGRYETVDGYSRAPATANGRLHS